MTPPELHRFLGEKSEVGVRLQMALDKERLIPPIASAQLRVRAIMANGATEDYHKVADDALLQATASIYPTSGSVRYSISRISCSEALSPSNRASLCSTDGIYAWARSIPRNQTLILPNVTWSGFT